MVNIYELGDSSDEDKASSMSSDSLADPSVTESSSSKRLTNGSDKSAETNGVHPEEARDHHVKDKSPEENKVSDREISACKQINRDRKILKCLFTGGTSSYLRSHAPGNTEQPFFFLLGLGPLLLLRALYVLCENGALGNEKFPFDLFT